jgi:glycosyltransferase involved in cell wall biosynthesis
MGKGVLVIVPTYSPNIGGVESHLGDLVQQLDRRDYKVFVHTYSPITTSGVKWLPMERFNNVEIRRYRWFGKNLLHKIEKIPLLHFLYITPYLFLRAFIFMLFNSQKIDIIHGHGFNAALIGMVLKIVFGKRLFLSIHAIYELNPKSITAKLTKKILLAADGISTLSKASLEELVTFGITRNKISLHRNWADLQRFKPVENKKRLREELEVPDNFTVVCVARLTEIKGVREYVAVAKRIPQVTFLIVGNGPLESFVKEESSKTPNLIFLGSVDYRELHKYYNLGDVLCIPSQYEEGYGRVAMEAVACGSPVVGSNKGGIPEAVSPEVSILTDPTVDNLEKVILQIHQSPSLFQELKNNCKPYADKYFSSRNVEIILKGYGE